MNSFKKNIGALLLAATAVTGFTAAPAMADRGYNDGYYSRGDRYDRYDRREYRRGDRYYRNNNYRNDRCDKGTGGTIIGAVAGGLLGNESPVAETRPKVASLVQP